MQINFFNKCYLDTFGKMNKTKHKRKHSLSFFFFLSLRMRLSSILFLFPNSTLSIFSLLSFYRDKLYGATTFFFKQRQ